ncbi:ligase-associated DNA damage response DEXH box helicase [Amylibacter sp. IMCC11727]|uniref:ligase-associated DNA damage response DEXH box helicase n=1 Tax=Amylibacter sp. IMCC11727 TaxID=3039851 RepID=UPI00244E112F|nr:ligase-associated DNA damage response DEXH box helicase [Amylibacter sp. IMCC11727]WGI22847.1 ligase-associated DNA damage response DEXH box helicase [Amylibacter sp. IMCC11727]
MSQLPPKFADWFAAHGWDIHPHQQTLLDRSMAPATLLIAPTGGGKTLAGFLPTLTELADDPPAGLHTLYVSPLKALAADIKRNLQTPIHEIDLPIRVEDRTGDTTATQKKRQRADPPHILLTTPESLALLLSYEDAPKIFATLQRVVVDEIHALAESKRGDQLMLCLSRLQTLAPNLRRVGLSATVEDPPALAQFLARNPDPCDIILADPGPEPDIKILHTQEPPPWSGAGAAYSVGAVLDLVKTAKTTLIFINTRAQAELYFRAIWDANEEQMPIALHHGSLSREARDKVEAAMVAGTLRAVVCTGTLDLGIDWGDVDLVIQVGAPKNIKRLVQRIGRSNHRYNAPSRAIIVPSNRFEVIEAQAALEAVRDNDLDGEPRGKGPRDVLCQHILIRACAGPFDATDLYHEIIQSGPFYTLSRAEFDACLEFCATGGYALRAYDRWQRLMQNPDGLWQLRDPRATRSIRMNIGTIVDTETLKVKWRGRGGAPLGEIEESFAATLTQGDTFLIGGQVVRYEGLREMTVQVTKGRKAPKIAVFMGTKFATSTLLSTRVIDLLNTGDWSALPAHTRDWLDTQNRISAMPKPGRMLVESYWRDDTAYTCFYGFAGRNALQTLGLLLTRRMEEAGLNPIGFVATDYAVLIWGLEEISDPATLLSPDGLRDGLDGWLAGNAVMKRSFRNVATIAGLIEKNLPGTRKTGRQATFSSDILYDTLLKYDPDHLLLQITREEAMRGLVDFGRIEEMLTRIQTRIDHVKAPHVTPLSAPMLLEVGKIPIKGAAVEKVAAIQAAELMREAGL